MPGRTVAVAVCVGWMVRRGQDSRRHSWWIGLGACLLAAFLVGCASPEPFIGTELTSGDAAAPFELRNQLGDRVTLSDHAGKVVLLTFLYTNCPDVCPITTRLLRDAHELLGDDADDVSIVAISVDPERDSVEAAMPTRRSGR